MWELVLQLNYCTSIMFRLEGRITKKYVTTNNFSFLNYTLNKFGFMYLRAVFCNYLLIFPGFVAR